MTDYCQVCDAAIPLGETTCARCLAAIDQGAADAQDGKVQDAREAFAELEADMVEVYACEFYIDGTTYGIELPAKSWKHAEELMAKLGGKVLGNQVCVVPAWTGRDLMEAVERVCYESPRWHYNAEEQLTAYLREGRKIDPTITNEDTDDELNP